MSEFFASDAFQTALDVLKIHFPLAIWETVYVTVLSTFFAIVIGLPLGVLLVAGDEGHILHIPKGVLHVLNVIINLLRSVPFLILMILVFPLTRAIVGTVVGTPASIVPLVIAAFPFVARLVEGSLREVNPNIIETAQSMGASPMQIICKVMLPESVPSLISNATIAITTVLGYSAMSGIIGGGGLGIRARRHNDQHLARLPVQIQAGVLHVGQLLCRLLERVHVGFKRAHDQLLFHILLHRLHAVSSLPPRRDLCRRAAFLFFHAGSGGSGMLHAGAIRPAQARLSASDGPAPPPGRPCRPAAAGPAPGGAPSPARAACWTDAPPRACGP